MSASVNRRSAEFIEAGRVRPMTPADMWHKMKGVA